MAALLVDHIMFTFIQAKTLNGDMMTIGWAIISTGDYADSRGAPGINQAEGAELVAVYSLFRPAR